MDDIAGGFPYLPPDLSTHGHRIDSLIYWMHIVMLVLFVGWGLFFLYTLVRFRRGRQPRADYYGVKSHASSYLELAVAVIEGVLLFGLSVPVWSQRVVDLPKTDPVRIRVVAQQFQWNMHYPGPDGKFGRTDPKLVDSSFGNFIGIDRNNPDFPAGKDDIVTLNQLFVPKGKPVLIELSSLDVIHSFFLPEMRVKHDVIPGMHIPLYFESRYTSDEYKKIKFEKAQADGETLEYRDLVTKEVKVVTKPEEVMDLEIACAQLCGNSHYKMVGKFYIQTAEEFDAWVKANAGR